MNIKQTLWFSLIACVVLTQNTSVVWSRPYAHHPHHARAVAHVPVEKMVFLTSATHWKIKGNPKSNAQLFDLTDIQTQKSAAQLVMINQPYPNADATMLTIDQVMGALQDKLHNKYTNYVAKVLQKSPNAMTLRIQALSDPTLGNEFCLIRVMKGPRDMHVMMVRFKDQNNYDAALAVANSARIVVM